MASERSLEPLERRNQVLAAHIQAAEELNQPVRSSML
jgi:hypothetical protein